MSDSRTPPTLPDELVQAFADSAEARRVFDALPQSHQREYVQWVQEGKRQETRERRAAQAVMRLTSA